MPCTHSTIMRFLFIKVNDFLIYFELILPNKKVRIQPQTSLYFAIANLRALANLRFI
jgi:hypothetical protein